MDSWIFQNPFDPDATFREKAGKKHRGYAANLEETVGEKGSVVIDYQYEQNIHSDSQCHHLKGSFKPGKAATQDANGRIPAACTDP